MNIQTFPMNVFPRHENNVIVVQPSEDAIIAYSKKGNYWYTAEQDNPTFQPGTYWFEIPGRSGNQNTVSDVQTYPMCTSPGDGFITVFVYIDKETQKENLTVAVRKDCKWLDYLSNEDVTEKTEKASYWLFYKDLQNYLVEKRLQAKRDKLC